MASEHDQDGSSTEGKTKTVDWPTVTLEEQLQLRDEAIKKLLDAHKELDREKLAKALNGLAILVGYPPAVGKVN